MAVKGSTPHALDPLRSPLLDSPCIQTVVAIAAAVFDRRRRQRVAIIRLEGLSVFGHHGARPYEKEAGQRLEVDLELEPTDARAETSDKLSDAVDYDALYRTVREVVEGKSFHLLETLAAATAETLLERFPLKRVRVRIAKQNLGWTTGGRAVIEVSRAK
jgi:dihydroneopterin aldolase